MKEIKKVIWEDAKIIKITESTKEVNGLCAIVLNGDGKKYEVFLEDAKIDWLKTFVVNPEVLDRYYLNK